MKELGFPLILEKLTGFDFPKVDYVIGIGRSGIVPAGLVAYQLNKELAIIHLNFRNEKNQPCHEKPVLQKSFTPPRRVKKILLVDDVAVSGQTLKTAKSFLKGYMVKTFVLKGQADYVLFPDMDQCVLWPWKKLV
jgi:hypoxanthine phosphoribosyltransferase